MYMAVACAREKRPFKIYYLGMTEVISSYEFGGRKFLTAGRQGSALGRPALSRELFFLNLKSINQLLRPLCSHHRTLPAFSHGHRICVMRP